MNLSHLRMAVLGLALTLGAPLAFAGGHSITSDDPLAPREGIFTSIQHKVADFTGIGAFHPATNHGTHTVWQAVIPDLRKVADTYGANADVATGLARLEPLYTQYGALPASVLDNDAAPEQAGIHALNEAAADVLTQLRWLGTGDEAVSSLLHSHAVLQDLLGTDALCTQDALRLNARAQSTQADLRQADALKLTLFGGLPLLLLTGLAIALRRRRSA